MATIANFQLEEKELQEKAEEFSAFFNSLHPKDAQILYKSITEDYELMQMHYESGDEFIASERKQRIEAGSLEEFLKEVKDEKAYFENNKPQESAIARMKQKIENLMHGKGLKDSAKQKSVDREQDR